MNAFDVELAIDRLEARLAAELSPHIAASAHAYAHGTASPAAIEITQRELTAALHGCSIVELRARSTRLLRVIAPMVIECAPPVVAARVRERTWDNWRALVTAREAHTHARFGRSHRVLVHALAGVSRRQNDGNGDGPHFAVSGHRTDGPIPPSVAKWTDRDGDPLTDEHIQSWWSTLCDGRPGALSILRSPAAHARTFVVERGARAIIVVPARIESPSARFTVVHELGHALLWLAPVSRELEWPRAIDEAAASYVARELAHVICADASMVEAAARRRLAIAKALDAIEAGEAPREIERPPWALWNDPHAQVAYIEAERIADEMPTKLRGSAVAEHLADAARQIDAAS